MRRVLGVVLVLAAVGTVLLVWPSSTSANNGPHGGYDLSTDKCAACHRAHTAVGDDLLIADDVYGLCVTCHAGSVQTDVVNGLRTGDSARLNGGGFLAVSGEATTSTHTVAGLPLGEGVSTGEGIAWGGASSGEGVEGVLECTSCHNPHGSTNYRILKDSSNGYPYDNPAAHRWVPSNPQLLDWVSQQVLATVDDGYNYAAGARAYYTTGMNYDPGTRVTTIDPIKGMSAFCATCHKQYLTKSGSAGNPSTDADYYFYPGTQDARDGALDVARHRHVVYRRYTGTPDQALRFGATGTAPANDPVTAPSYNGFQCLTCHFAHGTNATASGYAAGVDPTNDSALLYYDNRGICRSCHQKDK